MGNKKLIDLCKLAWKQAISHSGDPCAAGPECNNSCNEEAQDCLAAAGTQCADTNTADCNDAQCNGNGACVQTHAFETNDHVCRAASGGCDVEERCSGGSGTCPDDVARPDGFVCREAAGACDAAEKCDGASKTCPEDVLEPMGTGCSASTCADSTFTPPSACDETGACVPKQSEECPDHFACANGKSCRTSCEDNAHCAGGHYCGGGSCLTKKPDAETCASDEECENGHCVENVCCDSACVEECHTCRAQGSEGTCAEIPGCAATDAGVDAGEEDDAGPDAGKEADAGPDAAVPAKPDAAIEEAPRTAFSRTCNSAGEGRGALLPFVLFFGGLILVRRISSPRRRAERLLAPMLLLGAMLPAQARAEEPVRIAVFNIEAKVGIEQTLADVISDVLLSQVKGAPGITAIEALFHWKAPKKPEAKPAPEVKVDAPAPVAPKPALGHAGQAGLSLMGMATLQRGGKLAGARASYGVTDRFEAGINVYAANKPGVRPLVLVNIMTGGALKPFATAGLLVFFFEKVAFGAGGSAGLKYDLSRNAGLFVEVPVEYFFSVEKPYDKLNLMVSAGAEARLF